jgi:hypothetical protein
MISSAYETRIETIPDRNTLRITATREEIDYVVEEIREELKNVRRIQMSLGILTPPNYIPWEKKRWTESNFDETALSRLGELTRTKIEKNNATVCIPNGLTREPLLMKIAFDILHRSQCIFFDFEQSRYCAAVTFSLGRFPESNNTVAGRQRFWE